jgi:UDP-N-acetylglucosamine/UDP-N-acetylgalactosamine diphosphorylase
MTADLQNIRTRLQQHGQEHLLTFYGDLSEEHRQLLLEQIDALDLDEIDELIESHVRQKPEVSLPTDLQPPEIVPAVCRDEDEACLAEQEQARQRGLELIGAGKVAAFTVAGGQGTRLGYEGPKGCLPATPVIKKPLFRLFAEKIRAAALRHRVTIPWYIMTSPMNDTATRAHFRQNDYWGFSPNDVIFFEQGTMPAIGTDGKLLLGRPYRLAVSPDGHGGSLTALRRSGALEDMARRGIETISYFQVDNPLVHCIDPVFLGLTDLRGAEAAAKALPKRDPMEKLGNFCVSDGKVHVIEYSDMPDDLARQTNPDGTLRFSAGSIAIHVFQRAFVERLTEGGRCRLPWHRADKKVPHVDLSSGQVVQPTDPNAVKLEMFVFDALPLAANTVILETRRAEEFSPIKNAEGSDSLATSLYDQVRQWARWLESAGISVPRDADGHFASAVEISPLYADSSDELAKKVDRSITIAPGTNFYLGSKGQVRGG